MEYDWEHLVREKLEEIEAILPEGIGLVGVAACNLYSGEGALVERYEDAETSDVREADIRLDVKSDAEEQYGRTLAQVFGDTVPVEYLDA